MRACADDLGGDAPCWAHLVEPDRDIEDRADVEEFVRAFYRRVATDDVLGPVFEAAGVDWSVHIPKLVEFWAWQLLGIRGYEGNPLLAHRPVHAETPFRDRHYERWLQIFDDTLEERFRGPVADVAAQRARRMAGALRRLLDGVTAPGTASVEVLGSLRS
ncbi:MAG TPA: group III truncated hemoglobin [Microthrixaceae bacterium]|nr:group III truncated hemoglobin [Microthrixaceae bacterium]